jgi:hypothetical protein
MVWIKVMEIKSLIKIWKVVCIILSISTRSYDAAIGLNKKNFNS